MKRISLVLSLIALVATLIAPSIVQAQPKYGLGYFRPEAPVGGRVWMNEKVAIDAGIGFEYGKFASFDFERKADSDSAIDDEKLAFTFDAGVPFVLAGDETTKFFVRPGVTFASTPAWDQNEGASGDWVSATQIWISGTLGVEHWFGKHFSVGAGHGLVFKSIDPGLKGSDSTTRIQSTDFGISNVGFHFYF